MHTVRLFRADLEGTFLERPNRFLVKVKAGGRTLHAHCANPGRLLELLVPGRRVILERNSGPSRKTDWTLAAVYFQGKVISLISVRANRAAGALVLPALFPNARRIRAEYSEGESRFDYLVELPDRREFIEVKNCTLSAAGRTMFPDAPTARGVRHLRHLQRLARGEPPVGRQKAAAAPDSDTSGPNSSGAAPLGPVTPAPATPASAEPGATGPSSHVTASVLFILSHHDARLFTPNIHTDPEFAVTLADAAPDIAIRAAALSCSPDGICRLANPQVKLDLEPVRHARADSGAYLLLARLDAERTVEVGALGSRNFPPGWYLYAGSARKNLTARTARHLRTRRKRKHWHMDYLAEPADELRAFPIRSGEDLECELAERFSTLADDTVPGFGAGDCSCGSHLLYFHRNPLHSADFFDLLLHFRHGRMGGTG